MTITPKSPKEILNSISYTFLDTSPPSIDRDDVVEFTRISLASVLLWAVKQSPEWRAEVDNSSDKQTCDLCGSQSYIEGRNSAIDDYRFTLQKKAEEIMNDV